MSETQVPATEVPAVEAPKQIFLNLPIEGYPYPLTISAQMDDTIRLHLYEYVKRRACWIRSRDWRSRYWSAKTRRKIFFNFTRLIWAR
jgi:hypothetical protein